MTNDIRELAQSASQIIIDANGEIIGRTRIQKIAFMLELMNLGSGFKFDYKHYGPFSENLRSALQFASLFDFIDEDERKTSWGGFYSVYHTKIDGKKSDDDIRNKAIALGVSANAVELELAATAAFLASEGTHEDAWAETEKRKPEKTSNGRIEAAKKLYQEFLKLDQNASLPEIA